MGATSRMRQYLEIKGISKYKFYQSTGLSNGFLDKSENIGSDKCETIISYYKDINPEWLLTGCGLMLKTSYEFPDEQCRGLTAIQGEQGIPLIPMEAMAGFGIGNSSQIMEYECEKYVIPSFRGAEFLIQVKGNSMYPKYASGDIVACKKLSLDTFFQWNKVYVIDSEQGVLIKRIRKASDTQHIMLISENKDYDPFELLRQDIQSLAIVIGVIRLE